VSTAKRSDLVPELPSMEESGVENFDINSWNGYFGPAGMSPDVVKVLNTAINKIVSNPDTKAQLAQLGFDAFSGTPEEFAKFVQDQYDLWGQLIKAANIAPE
jgi:tripartite-type tricarboxylate transporter receptor subunit TctC